MPTIKTHARRRSLREAARLAQAGDRGLKGVDGPAPQRLEQLGFKVELTPVAAA